METKFRQSFWSIAFENNIFNSIRVWEEKKNLNTVKIVLVSRTTWAPVLDLPVNGSVTWGG